MTSPPGLWSDVGVDEAVRGPASEAAEAPWYHPTGNAVALFEQCHARNLAVMLKGPTGCGKTRFIEHMAWKLGRPLSTIPCHDDLAASDLIGRFLIQHNGTVWQDGPLTRAVREGAICYLDAQLKIQIHFVMLIICGSIFATGAGSAHRAA